MLLARGSAAPAAPVLRRPPRLARLPGAPTRLPPGFPRSLGKATSRRRRRCRIVPLACQLHPAALARGCPFHLAVPPSPVPALGSPAGPPHTSPPLSSLLSPAPHPSARRRPPGIPPVRTARHLAASPDAIVLGVAQAAARCPAHDVWPPDGRSVIKALATFDLDHKKWPELAADRLAWRAMLHSGQPPPAYLHTPRAIPDPRRPAHREHTHGPSDPRWRLPTPPSRTPCSGTLRRRGSA